MFAALLIRLIFPFINMIYIFTDNIGGLENIRNTLIKWAKFGQPLIFLSLVRPQVIIIIGDNNNASVIYNILK